MQRGNIAANRVKPESSAPVRLHVLRSKRLSPHFMRVTLGRGDIERFRPMGYDQWFRLFLPTGEGSLDRIPERLTTLSYFKLLAASKDARPVLRNYTVRAHRPDGPEGPELDIDFVLHGSEPDAHAGPAAAWARSCAEGDAVVLVDEGVAFNPPEGVRQVLLAADESGLPALAGVLASLPADVTGWAVVEVPSAADRQELEGPAGIDVVWADRTDASAVPGEAALAAARGLPVPEGPCYGWVVGESGLATGLRRHWVGQGLPKDRIMFCGYWRA
ncbi:siderophore-interacting protein [Streptomyces sp. NBC_01304]|uniref:siderophore-interacting protein n=1 Tax=Streptomyces sp. NBC_01304 TaxID=2903818 RepID=UPI002E0E4329|nr:siderophore-interacting protein [Streptomyces sp. NBC_01304]